MFRHDEQSGECPSMNDAHWVRLLVTSRIDTPFVHRWQWLKLVVGRSPKNGSLDTLIG
jgi:hypothetical protein